MFEGEDIAFNGLEVCNYRHLQGVAKNMGLPSNVKKVHLIEMIRAKKYCSEMDLKVIVDRVKLERKVNAQAKRKNQKKKTFRLQGTEISSTSNSRSPPISQTPKRPSDVVFQYSPDVTIMKYHPGPNILRQGTSILQPLKRSNESDRVLRSFNSKRSNYRIIDQNSCGMSVVKAQNSLQEILQERVQEIRQERALEIRQERAFRQERAQEFRQEFQQERVLEIRQERAQKIIQDRANLSVNVTVQKKRPVMNPGFLNGDRQLVPLVSRSYNTGPKPAKRQNKLSGIYPLKPREPPVYEYLLPTVGVRSNDGRITKINAVVQKPQLNLVPKKQTVVPKRRQIVVSVQDLKVDHPSFDNLTAKIAIEDSSLYKIDSEIDRAVHSDQQSTTELEPSSLTYQGSKIFSHSAPGPIYSMSHNRNLDPNHPKKVYKNRLLNKNESNKGLNSLKETSQEHTDGPRDEWNVYDINGQSIKTDNNIQSVGQMTERISTNNVMKGRITEPVSRDYQTEYKRFSQERTDMARDRDASTSYPNMQAMTDVLPSEEYESMDVNNSNFTVYYHKKIRAEQVRTQKRRDSEQLPRINDAFSQFNDVQFKNASQPLYVQVSEESERVSLLPVSMQVNSTCMLESLYNFKNQFVTSTPVLKIATTYTHCTYSTKTVPTAFAQPTAVFCNKSNAYERAEPEYMPHLSNYLEPVDRPNTSFGCDEVLSSSTASLETANSQELGANVTIPEMVEDALELISQDGDYMERIGMDVRVQCILCDWAGPKIILEYHIKKEHSNEIQQEDVKEWSLLFTLGELMSRQTWSSQLIQNGDNLYVLSAQYSATEKIMVSLSMIPADPDIPKHGRITIYNKISGQPYTFEGEIKDIPDSMPYEYGLECLTLDIGSLDLIPYSANLKLINRELVGLPVKTVMGQTELNNVEMVVYVKLLD